MIAGSPEETFITSINQRVQDIAKARGVSMAQVALAWSLSKPFVTAPIVGSTNLERLKDTIGMISLPATCVSELRFLRLVAGVHLKLTEEEVKSIDELYKPRSTIGHR